MKTDKEARKLYLKIEKRVLKKLVAKKNLELEAVKKNKTAPAPNPKPRAGQNNRSSPAPNPKPRAEQEEHPPPPPPPRRRPSPERTMHYPQHSGPYLDQHTITEAEYRAGPLTPMTFNINYANRG